jgi:hypothetical protein
MQDRRQYLRRHREAAHCPVVIFEFSAVHDCAIDGHTHAMQAADEVVGGKAFERVWVVQGP